jgi:hypothetical protein
MNILGRSQKTNPRWSPRVQSHAAGTFTHPDDVVSDPGLTIAEKKAILASWSSDARAAGSGDPRRVATPCQPCVYLMHLHIGRDDRLDGSLILPREHGRNVPAIAAI